MISAQFQVKYWQVLKAYWIQRKNTRNKSQVTDSEEGFRFWNEADYAAWAGDMAKGTCCSCRGLGSGSQHPFLGNSQMPVGHLMPSSGHYRHLHIHGIWINRGRCAHAWKHTPHTHINERLRVFLVRKVKTARVISLQVFKEIWEWKIEGLRTIKDILTEKKFGGWILPNIKIISATVTEAIHYH